MLDIARKTQQILPLQSLIHGCFLCIRERVSLFVWVKEKKGSSICRFMHVGSQICIHIISFHCNQGRKEAGKQAKHSPDPSSLQRHQPASKTSFTIQFSPLPPLLFVRGPKDPPSPNFLRIFYFPFFSLLPFTPHFLPQ